MRNLDSVQRLHFIAKTIEITYITNIYKNLSCDGDDQGISRPQFLFLPSRSWPYPSERA